MVRHCADVCINSDAADSLTLTRSNFALRIVKQVQRNLLQPRYPRSAAYSKPSDVLGGRGTQGEQPRGVG